jgi:hypothetical protein
MKHLWAGKAWGIGVAMTCMAIAACAPDNSVPPPAPPTSVSNSVDLQLSRVQRMTAISARSRLARNGASPTETVARVYDKTGRVVNESVHQSGKWMIRPSTLPTALSTRTLTSFLGTNNNMASLVYPGSVQSTSYVVSSSTVTDSVWTDAPNSAQLITRASDEPSLTSVFDVYYPSSATTGQFEHSSSGVVVMLAPGTADEFVELSVGGGDWSDGVSQFVTDTTGAGLLRTTAPQTLRAPTEATSKTGNGAIVRSEKTAMASMMMLPADPCAAYLKAFIVTTAVAAGFAIALGAAASNLVACAFLCEGLETALSRSIIADVGAAAAYSGCLAANRIA